MSKIETLDDQRIIGKSFYSVEIGDLMRRL
jgi:hypothetical protein